ncbi:het domain-containing [Fusarium acutatum]|uniref:Het domain-containing n=1 Tax=Fusarium acutatum TaxID=78861 RepID=A0A8H4NIA9_9HYPO|nr:het domain-containing [Fusarium acutatum]
MFNADKSDRQESTSFSLSHWLASAIQSWLFFGLASEALGRNIRHEEFAGADLDGPHSSIDLRIPEWYWRERKARWDELDDSLTAAEFEAKRTQLKKIYVGVQIILIYMDDLANDLDDDKLTEILLSVHMLLYLVAYVLDSSTLHVTQTSTSSASTKLLKRRMVKNGWCEKRLNFLDASPMFYPAFYFLSSLKPPRINAADHSGCSSDRCLVTIGYLEEVLSSLPISIEDWGLREWVANWWSSRPGEIEPPSRAYEYFWLDSFCIPQAVDDADLRGRAIASMNLIYAAASHTLVFDKGLQALDAGRRLASIAYPGRPAYYSPKDENLLDVVAYIYASNWMGRAWTLQEGILSGRIVFPLHGSLAYLKMLRSSYNDGLGDLRESEPFQFFECQRVPRLRANAGQLSVRFSKEVLLTNARQADRAARFVKAHSLLQSRTTTQPEDIPLILMNMSCMNANAISQSKTTDVRMKQLFYGLGSLPTELLFSDCARLGACTVDAWIPREIAPESFEGKHTLKLGSAGFAFKTREGTQALKFYLLSSAHRSDRFRLLLPNQKDVKCLKYDVEALQISNAEHPAAPTSVLCIVVDNEPPERGARFIVNRVVGNKYFLHFDCPLRLTEMDDSKSHSNAQQGPKHESGAVSLNGDFIIERSHEPQDLSISRPQNPQQYSDRLIVIGQAICRTINLGERYLIRAIWSDEDSMSTLFYIFYTWYSFKKYRWVERTLSAFVHRAWMATYQPDWDPNGPWKWFWKLSNW